MNTQRNHEIKAVVTALTVAAAVASGFLTIQDANAAPPKKSTVKVTRAKKSKSVYVKMSGSRRAAENRARQLYNDALAQKAADAQAAEEARLARIEAANAAAIARAAEQNNNQVAFGNTFGGNGQQVVYPGFGAGGPAVVTGGYYPGGVGSFTFPQFNSGSAGNLGFLGNGGFVSPIIGGGSFGY